VARRDRGLKRVGTAWTVQRFGALERGKTATHEHVIPLRAILIEQEDRLS
jgi:hypothetical protein